MTVKDQDSAARAAVHMKPPDLGGLGKPSLPTIAGHVNSLEQAQAEWKLVESLQKGIVCCSTMSYGRQLCAKSLRLVSI